MCATSFADLKLPRTEPSVETTAPGQEVAFRADRIQSALLIVALGMFLLTVIYCFQPRPRLQLIQGVSIFGVLAARAWARHPPTGSWANLPVHLAIASAVAAVVGVSLVRGQADSLAQYYLVLVPAFAACLLPIRATLFWTLGAAAGFLFIDQSARFVRIEADGLDDPFEKLLNQTVLVFMVFGAAYSQWRTTEKHVAALRQREEQVREQARELALARDVAMLASRAKGEFLATVSHEIRTPMNAVIGLTDLVLETKLDAEQRNLLETSRRSGEALLGILNDILDFSKIESDRIELEERPLSLRVCIEDALEMLAPRAIERNVELLYDHPRGVVDWIEGDPVRLRQIVVNLLSNAIKFTTEGDVTVRVEELESDGPRRLLRVAVRDSGIGIPPERRDRLFQPFSQVDASTTRRFGGTGLGLVISRKLVERMGGQIGVDSEPGQGSEFWFTLPAKEVPEHAGVARFDTAWLSNRSLLAVHDHPAQRALLQRDGEAYGMRIRSAASLAEAQGLVAAGERYDGLLVDSRAIRREGFGAARALLEALPVPAILLVSPGDLQAADEAEAGARFASRVNRPVRSKRVAETLVSLWLRPAASTGANADGPSRSEARPDSLAQRIPLRILVAEDNAVNQRVVLLMLQRLGYQPDVVDDGAKAVEAARQQAYDLILMDMQMPELDGVDATRAIRSLEERTAQPRIVALTANAMAEDRRRCLEAGMDAFLSKPLSARDLREEIERCETA